MNYFLLSAKSIHSYLFVFYLIKKCGIAGDRLAIVFFDANSSADLLMDFPVDDVKIYFKSEAYSKETYRNVKSVTVSSLKPNNAEAIVRCVGSGYFSYENILIRITDDEVDRWQKAYRQTGKLVEDKSMLIDGNVISVLNRVSRFLCLYQPWGKALQKMLGKKLDIVNVLVDANKFSDVEVEACYYGKIQPSMRSQLEKSKALRVMLFTKPGASGPTFSYLFSFLFLLLTKSDALRSSVRCIEIYYWAPSFFRHPLHALLVFCINLFSKFSGLNVKTIKLSGMPPTLYYSFLSSCHVLIAQDRGGLGAINEFFKSGGKVAVNSNSLNYQVFSGLEGLKFISSGNKTNLLFYSIMSFKEDDFEAWSERSKEAKEFFKKHDAVAKKEFFKIYM